MNKLENTGRWGCKGGGVKGREEKGEEAGFFKKKKIMLEVFGYF